MRSRSWTRASDCTVVCSRALSTATAAALANPTASSSSSSLNSAASTLSVRYRLPNTWSRILIGTPRKERIGGWWGGNP